MNNFIKFGNLKLGQDTAIFNMGSAKDCSSKKLGLCTLINNGVKCYAEKAETLYGQKVINFRESQKDFYRSTKDHELLQHISRKISGRKVKTRYLRFNESGDFHDQEDIRKLSYIAAGLKTLGIVTYGYSARSDLDFSSVSFIIKGSNHNNCPNGKTIVINKSDKVPEGFIKCPANKVDNKLCSNCNLCKIDSKINIAFVKH